MRVAWFNCASGVAGNMVFGALVDAGALLDEVVEQLSTLSVDGWSIDCERVERSGIRATHVSVNAAQGPNRTLTDIIDSIDGSAMAARAKQRAISVFNRLAEAEAAVHGIPIEDVHFHEVGAVDAIVDVCGSCIALDLLNIDRVQASSIAIGSGTVQAAHGSIPNPAPAVVEMLRGLPVHGLDTTLEASTPTGVAIVATLSDSFGAAPVFGNLESTGYGAGQRNPPGIVNATQVLVGAIATPEPERRAVIVECNVDDASGEVLAHTIERLMTAGARDAWLTPIVMKKGRPAHTVSAMCSTALSSEIARIMIDETGTFGVRTHEVERHPVARQSGEVSTEWGPVAVKRGPHRTKAEFDDAARLAREACVPLRDIIDRAESK